MPRTFTTITRSEFKRKLYEAIRKNDVGEDVDYIKGECWADFESNGEIDDKVLSLLPKLTLDVKHDLNIIYFSDGLADFSQLNPEDPPHGFFRLSNGMIFFGASAGGNWEFPMYFIIYWDGEKLRGYIPEDGNPWNTATREAYGNNEEQDTENIKERFPYVKFGENEEAYTDQLKWDSEAILRDIENNIIWSNYG